MARLPAHADSRAMAKHDRKTLDYFRREPDRMQRIRPMLGEAKPSTLDRWMSGCTRIVAMMLALAGLGTVAFMLWEWWTTGRITRN